MPRQGTSPYAPIPFHAIRALALTSIIIVAGILSYFLAKLQEDGYKLPWTLLIMLAAAGFAFLNLVISYAVFCCARLSPLFNMIVSIPILLMWTIGFGLIVYNMYGTLAHTCSKANWANDDGMMVCRVYKAFIAFVVIGWVCQVALIVVDVRAKRAQSSLGKYDKMDETNDVKLSTLDHSRNTSTTDVPYGIENYRDRSNSANSFNSQRHISPYGSERTQLHQVDDFRYQAPAQQHTQYQQSVNFYQPTYDGMRLR